MSSNLELVYFTDPMCSWCYGFGPQLQKLVEALPDKFALTIIPGGLRPDESTPMPKRMANEISTHWRHVEEASGLAFDYDFFEKYPGFIYNTTPACKAVVNVNLIQKERSLVYLKALQSAFYAQAKDPTQLVTFMEVARTSGIDPDVFQKNWHTSECEEQTRKGFSMAYELGIHGYPTLCLRENENLHLITRGYIPFVELNRRVEATIAAITKNSAFIEKDNPKHADSVAQSCDITATKNGEC